MNNRQRLLGLDIGEKRIGVALADNMVKLAVPLETINVDGNEAQRISELIETEQIDVVVVGFPRNQSGGATAQTARVGQFIESLGPLPVEVVYQDESLTSVTAENRLKSHGKPYEKGDIDKMAASIILQDYLEANYVR